MDHNERLNKVLTFVDKEWENMDLLFGSLKEDLALSMLFTLPEEDKKRQEIYYTAKAIDAFAIKLQERINVCKSNQGDN